MPTDGTPSSDFSADADSRTPPHAGWTDTYTQLEERAMWIRLQIARLQDELLDVLARQNALLPVDRMPEEVLLAVWENLVPLLGPDMGNDMMTLTHVCKRWRDTAIATPSLWTNVYMKNGPIATIHLTRSVDKPLSVFIPWSTGTQSVLPPHIHRLRRIHVVSPHTLSMTQLAITLNAPAPILEELLIECSTQIELGFFPISSPPHIFLTNTPSLKVLRLTRIFNSVTVGFLVPTVRELKLDGVKSGAVNCAMLLRVLQRASCLERLTLFNCSFADETGTDMLEPVSLPSLVRLHVSYMSSNTFTFLLRHLLLPCTVEVDYGANMLRDIHHPFALTGNDPGNPVPTIRRLAFNISSHSTDPTLLNCSIIGFAEEVPRRSPHGSLQVSLLSCRPVDIPTLTRICPLDSLKFGSIIDSTNPPQPEDGPWWNDVLVATNAMRVLSIHPISHGAMFFHVVDALSRQGDLPVLCPSLEVLAIVLGTLSGPEYWDAIGRLTSARKARGVPLQRLVLGVSDADRVEKEQMEAIRTQVGNLVLMDQPQARGREIGSG